MNPEPLDLDDAATLLHAWDTGLIRPSEMVRLVEMFPALLAEAARSHELADALKWALDELDEEFGYATFDQAIAARDLLAPREGV